MCYVVTLATLVLLVPSWIDDINFINIDIKKLSSITVLIISN